MAIPRATFSLVRMVRRRSQSAVALPAPPSCFAALPLLSLTAVEALHTSLPPELRRIHPADVHLTVAYFGRIDPALHGALVQTIGDVDFDGADVVLDEVLALPSRGRATALCLTLASDAGRDAVVHLMTRQRPLLAAVAGIDAETRTPLPHVTFARPRGRKLPPQKRAAILAWSDSVAPIGQPVRLGPMVLMRSLPPQSPGPHYEIVRPDADDPRAAARVAAPDR